MDITKIDLPRVYTCSAVIISLVGISLFDNFSLASSPSSSSPVEAPVITVKPIFSPFLPFWLGLEVKLWDNQQA